MRSLPVLLSEFQCMARSKSYGDQCVQELDWCSDTTSEGVAVTHKYPPVKVTIVKYTVIAKCKRSSIVARTEEILNHAAVGSL